ncbi:uncharacterized protein LOC110421355 [Herrania umbratica]|uniref:Uncharacterized protein LOC110421355 n=1 Tax=Herrania umbratica TaxID=108875 RepID=A0A6J1AW34_9ROSI|nr:uncharacterized protein LOC110421355 [Herrania umbratica]
MVFDWEVDIWEQFKECLQRIRLDCDFNDKLIWEHTPSGCYSTNSFCRSILDNNESTVDLSRNVWTGFAPPKVEVCVWQVIRGKVPDKKELRVWSWWLAEWGISWCILGDATSFFVAWNTCPMKVAKRKVWRMSFLTIVWSLWPFRNEIVFEGKPWDVLELEELIKIMMGWWVKSRWPNDNLSIMEIVRSLLPACAHIKRVQTKANVSGSAHLGDGLNSIRMRLGQLRVVGTIGNRWSST